MESFYRNKDMLKENIEQIKRKIYAYLKEKDSALIQHINIMLVGPCGSGKSTLINAVLNSEGEPCAKEGDSEPCTK